MRIQDSYKYLSRGIFGVLAETENDIKAENLFCIHKSVTYMVNPMIQAIVTLKMACHIIIKKLGKSLLKKLQKETL